MKYVLLQGCLVLGAMNLFAQAKSDHDKLIAGIDLGVPAYTAVGDMKGVLTGIYVKKDWPAGKHFAATISAGYHYFSGTVRSFDNKEVKNFSVLPLLAGVKYYAWKRYFLAFETGLNIGLDKNTSTKPALVPSLGALLPVGQKQFEVAVRYNATKAGSTFPEASLLNRGGYSFLELRLGWAF